MVEISTFLRHLTILDHTAAETMDPEVGVGGGGGGGGEPYGYQNCGGKNEPRVTQEGIWHFLPLTKLADYVVMWFELPIGEQIAGVFLGCARAHAVFGASQVLKTGYPTGSINSLSLTVWHVNQSDTGQQDTNVL